MKQQWRPSFWMLAASLVALLSLFLGPANKNLAIPLGTIAIFAAYFIPWRMPADIVPWLIRGVLFTIVIMTGPESKLSTRFWYQDPTTVSTLSICLEIELAIQHFLPMTGAMRIGQMLAITAVIFTAGTLTYDSRPTHFLAPLYIVCILGVLRYFRPKLATSPTMSTEPPPRTSRRWLLSGAALIFALTLGFGTAQAMRVVYDSIGGGHLAFLQNWIQIRPNGGISGNEQLRTSFNPAGSTNRVLKIRGTSQAMHLRGFVFDQYSAGRWLPTFEKRGFAPASDWSIPQGAKSFEVDRLTDGYDLMYLPLHTKGFATPADSTNQMEAGHRQVLVSVRETGEMMTYTAAVPSETDFHQGPLCRRPTADEIRQCLDVPEEIAPEVREIARSIHVDDPQKQIRQIVQYLQDNHKYSLNYVQKGEGDAISEFLTKKADAHCQFFAASAVMLMRLNGIPCRYVTGYFAHETPGRDAMVVRSRDAHAWAEAWIDGTGWITVEATPASGTPASAESVSLYQRIKDLLSDFFGAIGAFFRSLKWHHIAFAGGGVLAIALSIQAFKAWRARKKVPRIRAYAFPHEEYRRMAVEFEMALKRMGDPPAGAATWTEHLRDQKAQTHRSGRQNRLDAARRFVEAYNATRFGDPLNGAKIVELRKLLDEVKEM